jgi:hypothetical protein
MLDVASFPSDPVSNIDQRRFGTFPIIETDNVSTCFEDPTV